MQVTAPSIAETQLTGLIGSISFNRGGVQYTVNFRNGAAPECFRNSVPMRPDQIDAYVLKMIKAGRKFFQV